MTNFEKIETYLKHGLHVSVRDTDGHYQTTSPTKSESGFYRVSDWCDGLDESKKHIGHKSGYERTNEKCKDWTEITPFHLDCEPYPVGMKVKVIKTGEVAEIGDTRFKGMYILKDFFITHYSHTELIPYFEEEVKMTIKQIEEKLNITGLKIVK